MYLLKRFCFTKFYKMNLDTSGKIPTYEYASTEQMCQSDKICHVCSDTGNTVPLRV